MTNQKIALLTRAHMSTLNAIRNFGDTDAEPHFQKAAMWLRHAMRYTREGKGGEDACMINAVSSLTLAARTLGFDPVTVSVRL